MSAHKDVQRRTWDKAQYEERAKEREAAERAGRTFKTAEERAKEEARRQGPTEMMDPLRRTDLERYDFQALVGERKVVTAENALSEQGGFYCAPCDYLLKDHKSYIEHCNRPSHLQRVGLPMEVKRSAVDDIRARLAQHKTRQEELKKPSSVDAKKKRALDELKEKSVKKTPPPLPVSSSDADLKRAKKDAAGDDGDTKADVIEAPLEFDAAAFGLPTGFGSSKKR